MRSGFQKNDGKEVGSLDGVENGTADGSNVGYLLDY